MEIGDGLAQPELLLINSEVAVVDVIRQVRALLLLVRPFVVENMPSRVNYRA